MEQLKWHRRPSPHPDGDSGHCGRPRALQQCEGKWRPVQAATAETAAEGYLQVEGAKRSDTGSTLDLADLALDVVEAILEGCKPAGTTANIVGRMSVLPLAWPEQRQVLGFSA